MDIKKQIFVNIYLQKFKYLRLIIIICIVLAYMMPCIQLTRTLNTVFLLELISQEFPTKSILFSANTETNNNYFLNNQLNKNDLMICDDEKEMFEFGS